jgi:Tfp pilus assembly protein PilX
MQHAMRTRLRSNKSAGASGHSLVVTVIILALLGALGISGLHIAGTNMLIAANERDARDALLQADSGANIGHVFLETAIDAVNSSFYDDGTNASDWRDATGFDPADFPLKLRLDGNGTTYIRCSALARWPIAGSAVQIGTGYEGTGRSASHGGVSGNFLIRAHRVGRSGSHGEVDLGWRHLIR